MDNPILLINKPAGITSAALLNRLKRFFPGKIGHTGTLDPFADGLIIVLRGRYTRLTPFFSRFPKEYRVEMVLGQTTDTLDSTGKIEKKDDNWTFLTEKDIQASFSELPGEIKYPAPLYSAKKVKGRRLYHYARHKTTVKPPLCTSYIHNIHSVEIDLPKISFTILCSTGTYIRALAPLLGKRWNTGATINKLCRTAIGPARLEDCRENLTVSEELILAYTTSNLHLFIDGDKILELTSEEFRRLKDGIPWFRKKIFQENLPYASYLYIRGSKGEEALIFNPEHFPVYKKPRVLFLQ